MSKTTLAVGVLAAFSVLLAQDTPSIYNYGDTSKRLGVIPPGYLQMCTGGRKGPPTDCSTWIWNGSVYSARQNPAAVLYVEKFTKESTVLRLTDAKNLNMAGTIKVVGGAQAADGTGVPDCVAMNRDGSLGLCTISWGDKPFWQETPITQKTFANAKVPTPQVLHFCAAHCLTFTLEGDGKLHNYTNLPGQSNEHRILDIQSFMFDSVIIHRTDHGSSPGDGMMHGQMQYGNSNAISNEGWSLSWGDALNTLPGSDDERAMRATGSSGATDFSGAAQANLGLLQLMFQVFSPGSSSDSTKPQDARSLIGCAPGYHGSVCH